MEALLNLQKAFNRNYYNDFLTPIYEVYDEIDSDSVLVTYRGKEFLEKNLNSIRKEISYIIEDIKPLYQNAKSEVYLKLSTSLNNTDKLNYLYNIIQLMQVPLKQLREDFYINEKCSRYYAKNYTDVNIPKVNIFGISFNNGHNESEIKINDYDIVDIFDMLIANNRHQVLSFLPFSIFVIANDFIKFLDFKITEIENPPKEYFADNADTLKRPNQLTSNQIIILLDQLQILMHSKLNNYPKIKQAEILSLITGLNSQNLRENIGKLEKKPSELNPNYQGDIDKIKSILDKLK